MDKKALKILLTTYWSSNGWKPDGKRSTSPDEDLDLNVLDFERLKWGGVRHPSPVFATFDLERFLDLALRSPTEADVAIFLRVLRAIDSARPHNSSAVGEDETRGLLPSNKSECDILVNILGYTGILTIPVQHRVFGRLCPMRQSSTSATSLRRLGLPRLLVGGPPRHQSSVRRFVSGSRHWKYESKTHRC